MPETETATVETTTQETRTEAEQEQVQNPEAVLALNKKLTKTVRELTKRVEGYEEQSRAAADAEKTEVQRLNERLTQRERELTEVGEGWKNKFFGLARERDFEQKAAQQGVVDTEAALLFAEKWGLLGEVDDDGNVGNHDFKALRERKPGLFDDPNGKVNPGAGRGQTVKPDMGFGVERLRAAFAEPQRR